MKTVDKILLAFVITVIVMSGLYLWTIFSIGIGINLERDSAICVTPYSLSEMRRSVDATKSLYSSFIEAKNIELEIAQEETEKYKGWYFWIKDQQEKTTLDKDLEI